MTPAAVRGVAAFGAVVISFSAILFALSGQSPATNAFFRPAYGWPFLVALAWLRPATPGRPRRERLLATLAGGLMGLAFLEWTLAIDAIGAGLATVLGNTQVVFVGLAAWAWQGERPTRAAFVAVGLVLVGATATSGLGGAATFGDAPWRGVAWGLTNGVTYAAFLLAFRALNTRAGAPAGMLADATFGAALVTLASGLALDPGFDLTPSWPAHGWLLLAGVGPQAVGWMAILYALPRLPALETSVILLMQPVLTVLWAWLLLAETPSPVQGAGVAAVLAGVAIASRAGTVRGAKAAR